MTASGPYSLDLRGAAKHVCLGADTIKQAINRGDLPARRSSEGRSAKYVIRVSDLEAWVDGLPAA